MGMDDTLPSAEQHAQLVTMTVPGLGKTVPQYLNHILDVFIVRVLCNPALSHPALKDLCNTTCRVIQVLLDVEVITMCRSESEEVIKVLESNRWMEPGSSEHSKLLDLIAAIEKKVNPGNRDRVGTMRWRTGAGIWAKGASDFGNALRALEAAYGLACVVGKVLSGFTGLPHGMPHGLALLRASGGCCGVGVWGWGWGGCLGGEGGAGRGWGGGGGGGPQLPQCQPWLATLSQADQPA
jgi:hypothetical protein